MINIHRRGHGSTADADSLKTTVLPAGQMLDGESLLIAGKLYRTAFEQPHWPSSPARHRPGITLAVAVHPAGRIHLGTQLALRSLICEAASGHRIASQPSSLALSSVLWQTPHTRALPALPWEFESRRVPRMHA